jgi:hypothetical protein
MSREPALPAWYSLAMTITDQAIDQLFTDMKKKCGGVVNDYFGLLYLEQEHGVSREQAVGQIAFGGKDYGVDGFHFDRERRNFYLFQFKYSESQKLFKDSFKRLIDDGMQRIFAAPDQDVHQNQLLLQIKSALLENQAIIDRLYIHFVFMGDPESAEQSPVLDSLREDLENKKHLVEQFLGRPVSLVAEFKSAKTRKVGGASHVHKTRIYSLHLSDTITRDGPCDERMFVGFVRLVDLHTMFVDMGQRFFERNIRAALPPEGGVNRSLLNTFKRIVLDQKESPQVFAFNHNGVTLAAEVMNKGDVGHTITAPRLLNGAQTVTTFARFLKANEGNQTLAERREALDQLHVLCRVVIRADADFITTVTVNNNRQNPVQPWNLRANDRIQLELQEKFRDDVELFYERQEKAFQNLSDEELQQAGVASGRPIELYRLAQLFSVVDGKIDRLSRMRDVFDDDALYGQVFNESRLKADSRKIVLCYKVHFRMSRLLRDIADKGANKYAYINRARNLLWALICQGILNDKELEDRAERWGNSLSVEADYTDWLSTLATTRCRFVLKELVEDKQYKGKAEEGQYNFLKTAAAYQKCMEFAYKRWKWTRRDLD